MIDSFRNLFAIPDLRKRLIFTFGLLAVYRVGCNIPTAGIDPLALLDAANIAPTARAETVDIAGFAALARAYAASLTVPDASP